MAVVNESDFKAKALIDTIVNELAEVNMTYIRFSWHGQVRKRGRRRNKQAKVLASVLDFLQIVLNSWFSPNSRNPNSPNPKSPNFILRNPEVTQNASASIWNKVVEKFNYVKSNSIFIVRNALRPFAHFLQCKISKT